MLLHLPFITAFWACLLYAVTMLVEICSISSVVYYQLWQVEVDLTVFSFGPFVYARIEPVGPSSLVRIYSLLLPFIHNIINYLNRV